MTKQNEKHYANKHEQDLKINPEIAEMIRSRVTEGKLPCAVAFSIAKDLGVKAAEVGITLDLLEIKISKCQLGIFGYGKVEKIVKPMQHISEAHKEVIRAGLTEGKLPCKKAWECAEKLRIGKMDITSACEKMGIKISSCQLGAF
jgi:hypothetical protein